jgi:hypothetical protein
VPSWGQRFEIFLHIGVCPLPVVFNHPSIRSEVDHSLGPVISVVISWDI